MKREVFSWQRNFIWIQVILIYVSIQRLKFEMTNETQTHKTNGNMTLNETKIISK